MSAARRLAAAIGCFLGVLALADAALAASATAPAVEVHVPTLPLVRAAESAALVAVGKVTSLAAVDDSAYAAELEVGQVICGPHASGRLRVVWEELASGRAPRWKEGGSVLVALVEAPTGSLWRKRYPAAGPRWTIAAGGDAYLADPDRRSVDLLRGYLDLSPQERKQQAGVTALAAIVQEGAPPLGASALDRLQDDQRVPLGSAGTSMLMRVAMDGARPLEMRRTIVRMAGQGRLPSAHSWLDALVKQRGDLEADAWAALAQLDGALGERDLTMLLERDEAALRAIGARYATGDLAERRLPELIRADPAPEVQAAAVVAAVLTRTNWGLAAALPALADSDPSVRSIAVSTIPLLGTAAVAPLETEIRNDTPGAAGAIAALSLMGEPGRAALRDTAKNNPEEKLRKLALFALGEVQDEHSK